MEVPTYSLTVNRRSDRRILDVANRLAESLYAELPQVQPLEAAPDAAQGEVCDVANDNGSGQVVVSGNKSAVERAIALAHSRGAKRAILLPVSAPFHCALMQPAAEAMRAALGTVGIAAPIVPATCVPCQVLSCAPLDPHWNAESQSPVSEASASRLSPSFGLTAPAATIMS